MNKKLLIGLIIGLILAVGLVVAVSNIYDVNNDCVVNSDDAELAFWSWMTGEQNTEFDVNGDSVVDLDDVEAILTNTGNTDTCP